MVELGDAAVRVSRTGHRGRSAPRISQPAVNPPAVSDFILIDYWNPIFPIDNSTCPLGARYIRFLYSIHHAIDRLAATMISLQHQNHLANPRDFLRTEG